MSSVEKIVPQQSQVLGHYINGQHLNDSGRLLEVTNPATGECIRQVAAANTQTVEEAVAAAKAAFPAWRDTPPLKRARIMFKF